MSNADLFLVGALLLAFVRVNGTSDVSTGIAILVGSGLREARHAIRRGALMRAHLADLSGAHGRKRAARHCAHVDCDAVRGCPVRGVYSIFCPVLSSVRI